MGKTGKWIKDLFKGKKEKEDKKRIGSISSENSSPIQSNNTKEKKRWSFRRSTTNSKDLNQIEPIIRTRLKDIQSMIESEEEEMKHEMTKIEKVEENERFNSVEEIAAIKIQSVFRSYLAKKALRALKGIVKLQALLRGHLVRRQATSAFHCMQALVRVQARTRAQRISMAQESHQSIPMSQSIHRKPPYPANLQDNRVRKTYYDMEENIKIVEMDVGDFKRSSSDRSIRSSKHNRNSNQDHLYQISHAQSALTNTSPSGYLEGYSINSEQNSPLSSVSKPEIAFADYPFYPNYMANTESSKAKVRSQSAPKQRSDPYEKQLSKQRLSMEGKSLPQLVKMQRSSSHVSSTAEAYHNNPWSIKLDKSTSSLIESESGSTSTAFTNSNYYRSMV